MSRLTQVDPKSGEVIKKPIKSAIENIEESIEVGSTFNTMDGCTVEVLKIVNDIVYVQISSDELKRDMVASININKLIYSLQHHNLIFSDFKNKKYI